MNFILPINIWPIFRLLSQVRVGLPVGGAGRAGLGSGLLVAVELGCWVSCYCSCRHRIGCSSWMRPPSLSRYLTSHRARKTNLRFPAHSTLIGRRPLLPQPPQTFCARRGAFPRPKSGPQPPPGRSKTRPPQPQLVQHPKTTSVRISSSSSSATEGSGWKCSLRSEVDTKNRIWSYIEDFRAAFFSA